MFTAVIDGSVSLFTEGQDTFLSSKPLHTHTYTHPHTTRFSENDLKLKALSVPRTLETQIEVDVNLTLNKKGDSAVAPSLKLATEACCRVPFRPFKERQRFGT